MGYSKILFDGLEIQVPTGEVGDVVRQLREVRSSLSQKVPTPLAEKNLSVLHQVDAFEREHVGKKQQSAESLAISFLKAIKGGEDQGLSSDAIATSLGARHVKGIGSKLVAVNKLLESHGFEIGTVYSNDRNPFGEREWREKSRLRAALESIEKGVL